MKKVLVLLRIWGAVIMVFGLLSPLCGNAATFTVTTTADGTGAGTLRSAIAAAEAAGGNNTVSVPAGVYDLTQGEIVFGNKNNETITIVGAGASTTTILMDASNVDRIFLINLSGNTTGVTVSISGITFSNGYLSTDGYGGSAILCGGPTNTTNIQNCAFTGNSLDPSLGASGGAVAMEGGGSFTITRCTFSNNSDLGGNGGALFYDEPGDRSGALTITNSIFNGNSCTLPTQAQGGAIILSLTGDSLSLFTSTVSITQNTFINNVASGPNSIGGAISIDNAFLHGNTAFINFNRFTGNKAASIPDIVVGDAQGNVDISNNWWGLNASPVGPDPHALQQGTAGGGTMVSTPYLVLSTTKTTSTLCGGSGGSTVVSAGFIKNSAGTTVPTASMGAFIGLPVVFSATLGTISAAQSTTQSDQLATATVTAAASSGTVDVQAVVDSVSASDVTAQATYTLTTPTVLPSASTSGTIVIGGSEPATDGSCGEIASIVASGASPVSGTVAVSETIDPSVQSVVGQAYVMRHYDVTPAANASTATAKITLYFLQSDFNAYNVVVNSPSAELPTSSTDATGKANLTITQFHGSGSTPGQYSGWTGPGPASVLISPGSSNVVWNSAMNWWEVSFPVTGFSGFYVTGPLALPLPVVIERFNGVLQGTGVLLNWQVGVESGLRRYEVQGSTDGVSFSTVGAVGASGASAYQYFVADPYVGTNYYRLKLVNTDGTFSYSTVVVVDVEAGRGVEVLNNPTAGGCTVRVTSAVSGTVNLRLMDISGKVLRSSDMVMAAGVNTFLLPSVGALAKGVYLLSVVGPQVRGVVKVVKE